MISETPEAWTVDRCWKELEPAFIQVARLIATAPLDLNERAGLSLMALTNCIGIAAASLSEKSGRTGSIESHAREAVELVMAGAFPPKRPDLKIVKP